MDNKDYNNLSLEELIAEEKKIKKKEITSAVIIGCLIGIIVYGVANGGFGFIYIFIPLALIYVVYKNSQKNKKDLQQVQEAKNAKSA